MSKPITSVESKVIYEFGPFRVDTAERVMVREGAPVPLTPKAFDVLLLLVESHGHIVEKAEVMDRVWADSFVEEGNLKATVAMIRKALGESASGHRYIETVPRRGYRFTAVVTESKNEDITLMVQERTRSVVTIEEEEILSTSDPSDEAQNASAPSTNIIDALAVSAPRGTGAPDLTATSERPHPRSKIKRLSRGAALIAFVVVFVGVAAWLYQSRGHHPAETFTRMKVSKLTSNGNTRFAAISPDGKYVANVAEDGGRQSLWVRLVATGIGMQVVAPAQDEFMGLVFSPDANFIYYTAIAKGETKVNLYQVSVLGGPAKKLKDDLDSPPSLSPDGKQFAFMRKDTVQGESELMVARLDGAEERKLNTRRLPDFLDYPAWSPDGKTIACTTVYPGSKQVGLVEVSVSSGAEKPITSATWTYILQLKWLRDGRGLVMSARAHSSRNYQIWYLAYPGGEVRRITNDLNNYEGISLTDDANTLVTVQDNLLSTMWAGTLQEAERAQQITATANSYLDPSWTPDGRVIYSLAGSLNRELWIMNVDGSDQKQLTFDEGNNFKPTVSPDDRYIFCHSDRSGHANIWRYDIDGGNPKQLTSGDGEYSPQCLTDGKWVVYMSTSFGTAPTLWKVPIDGGEALQLSGRPARSISISPDGKLLAGLYASELNGAQEVMPSISIISLSGGETQKVFDLPSRVARATDIRWTPDGQALTFIGRQDGAVNIWIQLLDGSPATQLTSLKGDQLMSFALSRDGSLVYSRGSLANDVVLISGFR